MLIFVEIWTSDPVVTPTGHTDTDTRDFDNVCQMSTHFCCRFTNFNKCQHIFNIDVEFCWNFKMLSYMDSDWLRWHRHAGLWQCVSDEHAFMLCFLQFSTQFNIVSTCMLIFVEISNSDPARTPRGRPGSTPWLAPHWHRTSKGTPRGDPGNVPERRCAEGGRCGRNLEVLLEGRGACARIAGASQRSECRA